MTPCNFGVTVRRVVRGLLCAVALSACRDAPRDTVLTPRPAIESSTAGLVVERLADDSALTVMIRLSPGPDSGPVGSMTASIDYDTTTLRFVRDVTPSDGALRAVHDDRGRLRVAVATASGLPMGDVALLRFSVRTANGLEAKLGTLALQVVELHDIGARDVKASLAVLPVSIRP